MYNFVIAGESSVKIFVYAKITDLIESVESYVLAAKSL